MGKLPPAPPAGPLPASQSTPPIKDVKLEHPPDPSTSALIDAPPLRHDLTAAALEAELPDIRHELIALGFVVHRVVGQVYAQLEGLTDILPSKNDTERKQLLVNFVRDARKHLVRLLVIAKWSACAQDYKRAQDLVGFLQAQNAQLDGSTAELADLRDSLTDARVRDYDISTALEVLTTGTYDRVPAVIKTAFATPARLPDEAVRALLHRLDDVIRLRLAVHDDVPPAMRSYRIDDGRSYFSVAGLFEASPTLSGETDDDRWFLLHADFSRSNVNVSEPMCQRVIALANDELAPRESADPAQPDRPLHRLYSFLADLALDFRLEQLHSEALKLAATSWKGNISVAIQRDARSLVLSYWTNAMSLPNPSTQSHPTNVSRPPPPPPPRIHISLAPKRKSAVALIAEGLDATAPTDLEIVSRWDSQGFSDHEGGPVPVMGQATIEDLLEATVRKHLDLLCRQLFLQVREHAATQLAGAPLLPLSDDGVLHGLRIRLREAFEIDVIVDQHTGRLQLRPMAEVSSYIARRIRLSETSVNASRHSLIPILGQLRALALVQDVEAQAAFAGLTTYKLASLRSEDRKRLNTLADLVVMIPLPQLATYHVLAIANQYGLSFALAALRPPDEEESAWSVVDLVWVQPAPASPMQDLTTERLLDVVRYCVLRVTYLGVEQDLASRIIPYARVAHVSSSSAPTSLLALPPPPHLVFRLDDILPGSRLAHRNIVVRAVYRSASKPCKLVFYLRLTSVRPALADDLPTECELDVKTRLLTARYDDATEGPPNGPLSRFLDLLALLFRLASASPVPATSLSSTSAVTKAR